MNVQRTRLFVVTSASGLTVFLSGCSAADEQLETSLSDSALEELAGELRMFSIDRQVLRLMDIGTYRGCRDGSSGHNT
jgi:ribosomal protein S13